MGIPFQKQLSFEQPLPECGYQGPDGPSHLKLIPQLLLPSLGGVGLREGWHSGYRGVTDQGSMWKSPGLQTPGLWVNNAGVLRLRSGEQRREVAHLSPVHRPSPCAGVGPPGMLEEALTTFGSLQGGSRVWLRSWEVCVLRPNSILDVRTGGGGSRYCLAFSVFESVDGFTSARGALDLGFQLWG